MSAGVQALADVLVVDFSRYLPGAYASRQLARLGARVVRVESPEGDPLRRTAAAWDAGLRAGTESVVCDLETDTALARALASRADVVLESFRPGVAERLGIGPEVVAETAVYCSITGFGTDPPHAARAGHDLNYLGYAGVLEDTAPHLPPTPIADLAAGGLAAATEVLAALLARERTGRGACLVISMTHRAHDLVAYRVREAPPRRLLTGELACYRIYATSEGRHLTVAALEPKFFARLCELLGRSDLVGRQYDADQEPLAAELEQVFVGRTLYEWSRLFDGEDVCVGPVSTREEAAAAFGESTAAQPVHVGAHTDAWRKELGLARS